jgi:hypothetical protein
VENNARNGPESGRAGKPRRRLCVAAIFGMLGSAGLLIACRDDADDSGGKGARTQPGGWRPPPRPVPPARQ